MLAIPPFWASSKNALLRANTKPPVELVVADLTDAYENLLEKFKKNQSVHQSVSEDNVKVIHKLEIMVCTICNLNCVYCYANGGNYYGEEQMLSYEVVDALVRYLKQEQIKVEMVQFFGGEPLPAD